MRRDHRSRRRAHHHRRCRRECAKLRVLSCAVLFLVGASPKSIFLHAHDDIHAASGGTNNDKPKLPPDAHKNHALSIDRILLMAGEIISTLSRSDGGRTERERRRPRGGRRAMYLPPPPVTPFRGGLKPVAPKAKADSAAADVESSEDSALLEASSSDFDRYPGVSFSSRSKPQVGDGGVSSWAPEDYPDPWTNPTLCGGAATASMLSADLFEGVVRTQPYSITELGLGKTSWQSSMRRPLFCDPDQVLDKETLRDVAIKLRAFAETFAYDETLMEGGDFGFNEEEDQILNDQTVNENIPETDGEHQDNNPQDQLAESSIPSVGGGPGERRLRTRNLSAYGERMYSDSVGGVFSSTHQDKAAQRKASVKEQKIEVAIALVQRINLPAILRADSYFFYSDQDDMVNDAAQYFARYIHDTWSKRLSEEIKANNDGAPPSSPTNIVLIFISTVDRICYISSGTRIATILPWWRLEHVVQDMKQDLRRGRTGDALNVAIDELTALLLEGPPSFGDRANDFFQRFGVVMLFTAFTFVFATWGECRDRRKRLFLVERRSRMSAAEKERAWSLQKEFRCKMCPICLEPFDLTPNKDTDDDDFDDSPDGMSCSTEKHRPKLKRVDSFGIPLVGTDDEPIKMLRCGHIFDSTCWKMWADSGHGDPMVCPVCRQDVGRPKKAESTVAARSNAGEGGDEDSGGNEHPNNEDQRSSLFTRIIVNAAAGGPSGLVNYGSVGPQAQRGFGAPFAPLAHPTFRRLRVPVFAGLGLSTGTAAEATVPLAGEGLVNEQTPLFAENSSDEEGGSDY